MIAFGLFMAFILYFVFKVQGNSKYDNELVVEEYYKEDSHYGDRMAKLQNTAELTEKPTITNTREGIMISFPESFNAGLITGEVSLYRPSDKKLDFKSLLRLSGKSQLIPRTELAGGLWDITLTWKYAGREFMAQQQLYIN